MLFRFTIARARSRISSSALLLIVDVYRSLISSSIVIYKVKFMISLICQVVNLFCHGD